MEHGQKKSAEGKTQNYGVWSGGIFVERLSRPYEYTMERRHFHREYEIYYLLSGERYYFIDSKTYPVRAGPLVFINRGQIHKTSVGKDAAHERLLIQIREERLSQWIGAEAKRALEKFFRENSGILNLEGTQRKEIEEILMRIETEALENIYGSRRLVEVLTAELLLRCARILEGRERKKEEGGVPSARHSKVQEVAEYIGNHFRQEISLELLAEHFFVSKYYLCRIFKDITGFTVNEFTNVTKVKHAAILLEKTDWSITEIAGESGYDSITYFEKMFKRYLGMTPSQYKKEKEKDR